MRVMGCPRAALAATWRASPAPRTPASANLSVLIPPTPNKGQATPGDALDRQVTTTSRQRVSPTRSRSDGPELAAIRRLIGIAIGLAYRLLTRRSRRQDALVDPLALKSPDLAMYRLDLPIILVTGHP